MPTLDWLNRANAFATAARVPYRLLEQVSVHAPLAPSPHRGEGGGEGLTPIAIHDNLLIQGDNLEHAQWLSMMLPRLQLLRELLREDGSIWVTIDDNEGHYLKVLMDEVFGRGNFVANVVWRSSDNSNNDAKTFSIDHNHVLVYSRSSGWLTKKLDAEEKRSHFRNPDDNPRGSWFDGNPLNSPKPRENLMYNLTAPNGNVITHPPNGWRWERETMEEKMASGEIRFNDAMTGIKRRTYLLDMKGLPPSSLWTDLIRTGHNRQAKTEQKAFGSLIDDDLFDTPKPEKLFAEILQIATSPNDLILDSFLGSGTTAAATHCLPRLQKVIDGEQGGISKAVNWQGGGGFRFMTLGAPVFDEHGRIHPDVRFATLAAFIWQQETGAAWIPPAARPGTPYLGTNYQLDSYSGTPDMPESHISSVKMPKFACYLLFNGILADKRPASGNVLTREVLDALLTLHAVTSAPAAPLLVYGEACRLGPERLKQARVTFKHIPYDIKAR